MATVYVQPHHLPAKYIREKNETHLMENAVTESETSCIMDIQNKYKKLDHKDHVLTRHGMYIGSIEEDEYETWVFDQTNMKMVKRKIKLVPGLYKIFDEILVNAIDHYTRTKQEKLVKPDVQLVKNIKIDIDKDTGVIKISNDGQGIEIEKHPDHGVYIPELIFGHMLTSANYNDEEDRVVGGQNGIGAKACNIFSKSFIIETVDAHRKKSYVQEFRDNMSVIGVPTVKYCAKKPFTSITFTPDYERFKMPGGLTQDMYDLFVKRAYDVCALTDADVNVYLNNVKLEFKTFERYTDLFLGSKTDHVRVYEKINDRLEVIASSIDIESMGFEHVSFVNGIWTLRGGKHVDHVSNAIVNGLCDLASKKKGKNVQDIKPQHLKNYLMVFVKATIPNPTFDSQTKDLLTTPASKFGFKCELSDKFLDKLYKSDLVSRALALSEANTQKTLKKTDGKKSNRIKGLVKLDDANFAGTAKSKDCVLILTEGDSAKSMALCGLAEVGRDYYGVFPLRGKLLNVKDVTVKKLLENEEIQNIKKILGLESGKTYHSIDELRYGKIMIMSDQDHDGSHIRGLIMNLFHTLWPSLCKTNGFLTSLLTPIIKITHKASKEQISFYNMVDYNAWAERNNTQQYDIKYYKGLGTSTEKEAKEYFKHMRKVTYDFQDECDDCLDLAFNKKKSNMRKQWLENYDPLATNVCSSADDHVTFADFVNKELVHFSVYDVKRSIPSMVDGLKPSQRKILYSCFKRNLVREVKVSQLAGYVSENAAYHHGEASLQGAIICMAQNFVGSNNINILKPNGQFGSRVMGGKDASQPRYIFTELDPIAFTIFNKEDCAVLQYLEDDGQMVEPEYYVPVLPMALVNSCLGIGTGFSTSIPPFNPLQICQALKTMIQHNGDVNSLKDTQFVPWYRGFKGTICEVDGKKGTFESKGLWSKNGDDSILINELPVGTWTEDYKAFLEEYMEKNPKVLKDYESHYTTQDVCFKLHFYPNELSKLLNDGFEKEFKLANKSITTTNMHLFDKNGIIKKYGSVADILADFYQVRIEVYEKRKAYKVDNLENLIQKTSAKAKFILDVCNGIVQVMGKSKIDLEVQLESMGYPKYEDSYTYLLSMPIHSLTKEKQEALMKELVEMETKLELYKNTSVEKMWLMEINEFEAAYATFMNEYEKSKQHDESSGIGNASKTSKPRLKIAKKN